MKLPVKIILSLLCAAMVLAAPFVVSSPTMLEDAQWEMIDQLDAEDSGLLRLFLSAASAEEEAAPYSLPVDRSAGMKPNPALFTDAGYEDASIRVQMESREGEKGVIWRIAWIEIASPTQLRTDYAPATIKKDKTGFVTTMAKNDNAVVALNGDNFSVDKAKHSFIYRNGEMRQTKLNKIKDILIVDENGDFHTFVKSAGADTFEQDTGLKIMHAFMFGPVLVQGGQELKMDLQYGYNPEGRQPRSAIGQLDTLSYVLVIADNEKGSDSVGVTHQELAAFMAELGCKEAYNLDGGNSAIMVFNNSIYNVKKQERDITDIIYFASAVPAEEWEQ
ncbi:MAG: phosphodiester glycosidase family protein [Clostridia bacterium]|nr:phosphodiester glycosidase family protein [Clostridia bacterium]